MTGMASRIRCALAAAGLWLAPHAHAQPAAAELAPALPEIRVVDRAPSAEQRRVAPVATIVITEEEVERYGDATVGDVLRRLPGMSFTGPAGVVKDVRLRGLDKGNTLFLINGEPVPSATRERQFQVDRLPADMIERIEIVRSPTALQGADGIGGAINIVLKQRIDELTRLRAALGRNGALGVGDAVLQWSRRFGDEAEVLLALSHTRGAEDVTETKETTNAAGAVTQRELKQRPTNKAETLVAPRLVWRRGAGRLTLQGFASDGSEDKRERSTIGNAAGMPLSAVVKHEERDDRVRRLALRYEHGAGARGLWFVKAGVQAAELTQDTHTVSTSAAGVVTTVVQQQPAREGGRYAGAGIEHRLGERHRVALGLDLQDNHYDTRSLQTQNGADRSNPVNTFGVDEQRLAAYVQDEWAVAPAHLLTAGLRLEQVRRHATGALGSAAATRHDGVAPSLHHRWAFDERWNLRASWSRSQRLPRFDQLNPFVQLRAGTLTHPDVAGNPALRPERAHGVELGVEHYAPAGRGVVALNLYRRSVSDFVQRSTVEEGGRFVQRPLNLARARFWGAELDARWALWRDEVHRVDVAGSHAELRGRVRDAGTGLRGQVQDMPPRITTLSLDWMHRPARWQAGFSVTHQPAFATTGVNNDGVLQAKARNAQTLLDAYVGKSFGPQAELRLIGKNLLRVRKSESQQRLSASGTPAGGESKVETSEPTLLLTLESRF
jgi:outer membrane receptor for ferrienterochelin and colicins